MIRSTQPIVKLPPIGRLDAIHIFEKVTDGVRIAIESKAALERGQRAARVRRVQPGAASRPNAIT